MAFKLVLAAALLAVANAGFIGAPIATYAAAPVAVHAPAIGASHESTVRSLDGNHAVSHYSKAVDTAFSSVRKSDTRVHNDAVAYAPAAVTAYHAAPDVAYAAPAVHTVAAAPAVSYAAPAVAAYHAPAVAAYHAPAVAAYHAPAAVASPVIAKTGLLGVAYSAAPAVTHLSFDGYGVHYGY